MNILIVGGNGRIGSSFISFLLDKQVNTINVDITEGRPIRQSDRYTFIKGCIGDISTQQKIASIITQLESKRIDAVCFLARTRITNNLRLSSNKEEAYKAFDLLANSTILIDYLIEQKLLENTSLVFVSSTNAYLASHQSVLYHALKGATLSANRAIALKLGPLNIRSNVLVLGLVSDGSIIDDRKLEIQRSSVPLLSGPPSLTDINHALDYLCSTQSRSMTGSVITLDAGMTSYDTYTAASMAINSND